MDIVTGCDKLRAFKEGPVGWIVFDNPAKRNAISAEMHEAMQPVIEDYTRDAEIRVIVLRGAGEQAFISGGDISKFAESRSTIEGVRAGDAIANRTDDLMSNCPKPTIAMIRGYCLGGGMRMALSCDVRISADDGRFGIPAAKLGVGYRYAGVKRLSDLVGLSATADIFYSARQFNAAEAKHLGLVNYVVPAADLEKFVADYVANIARNAPLTIKALKTCLIEIAKDPDMRNLADCEQVVDDCFASQDFTEGRTAFMEKRKASFKGR